MAAIREKYKRIPNIWILTVFKNIKKRGWFRSGKKFYQKTSSESARRIIDTNTYSVNFGFGPMEKVMTYNEEIDTNQFLKDR